MKSASFNIRRITGIFLLLFALLFAFRLIYGFVAYPGGQTDTGQFIQQIASDIVSSRVSNVASSKYEVKKGSGQNAQVVQVDQKYEKTANLACQSSNFESDETFIRKTIESSDAIIQFQQQSGQTGSLRLYLQIGVQPASFDDFLQQIRSKLQVLDFTVTKKDKTNEYRELNSKVETLKATRAALVELKSKGGKIEEYIDLENRILEIDQQLQGLGVQLGSFDNENEFCTVNISLQEKAAVRISWMHRVKVALEWTIKYYLLFIVCLTFMLVAAYVLVRIVERVQASGFFKDSGE